jgi:hypothetical protein
MTVTVVRKRRVLLAGKMLAVVLHSVIPVGNHQQIVTLN